MSMSADYNQTVTTPNGVVMSRHRGRVVHPDTPKLSEDTVIRRQDHKPLVVNGIEVTFGMLPIERRWAVDDSGVMLDQRDFEAKHLDWYVLHFRAKDKNPDDPTSRPIPSVENFLSETWDREGTQYQTIGFDPHQQAEGPVVRPDFEINDAKELTGYEQVKQSDAEARAEAAEKRADDLERKFEILAQRVGATDPTSVQELRDRKPREKTIEAPCGKMLAGGLNMHMKNCKDGCNEPEAAS